MINETPTLTELMGEISSMFSYDEICKMSDEQKQEYDRLLTHFKDVNGRNSLASKEEKGKSLENLVDYLLKISGNIFRVVRNVRTNTNEIDQIVELNQSGKALYGYGLLFPRINHFLGECKNYNSAVSVTYIGKFYSLLQTTQNKTGIIFSYHGISGNNWRYGSGLVKKIYLQRENEDNRTAVIDFSLPDFEAVANGKNFLDIIENKLLALQHDTSIDTLISTHPAEIMFKT